MKTQHTVDGEAMRTDETREAGRRPQDLDQSNREEPETAEFFDAQDRSAEAWNAEQLSDADEASGARSDGLQDGEEAPRSRSDLVRTGIRGLGQTLITAGLVVLLFVVYALFVTDLITNERQEDLTQELRQVWEDDPAPPAAPVDPDGPDGPALPGGGLSDIPLGEGFAFIRIPTFGADFVKVVIEGTDPDELEQGPGHYVDSALPGEMGNFSLAGHRVGKGSPFLDLDQLKPGDAVVIETADMWFTYRVLGDPGTGDYEADPSGIPGMRVVTPEDTAVVNPIPGAVDTAAVPTGAYLTLTTCEPKFSARLRLIIHAGLEGPGLPKSEYPDGPPALTGE
jgi:sortase A